MAVIRVFRYFIITFLFNANIICGSIIKNSLRSNAPISLFDLLHKNNVDIKIIDGNEAEDLVKSIVKQNRINKPKIIPLSSIPLDSELTGDKLNEDVVKNYGTEGLLSDLLNDNSKIGLINPDYELVRGYPKNYNRKLKKSLHRSIPPDYELVRNGKLQGLIPPDYELVNNRNIPPDYELTRHGKLQGVIPPDYEVVKNRDIPPDYELGNNRAIPPDYELKIKDLIPPDYELMRNRNIPPDYELVKHEILQGLIPPDYELIKNKNIPPDYEFVRGRKIKGVIPPDYELVKNRDIPPDYELLAHGMDDVSKLTKILLKKSIPSNHESPLLEYNNNNAYLKPLIRLLNRVPITDESEDDFILVRSPDNGNLLAKFGLYDQRYMHKEQEYPKQYRPLTQKEEKIATNLIKHIQYLVTKINSPILKRLALDRLLDVLSKVENLRQGLEIEGQLAEEDSEKNVNPPPLSAYVPFFNYWTYQKTIVEDECPEESVKIGNVCSRTPPH